MKPDWDKLIAEYKDSKTVVVADVDCTAGGKAKCEEVGVRGYPTIKYGDPDDLQDYKGGRSFEDLKKFAEGLGPQCSPANLELCDAEKKTTIEKFKALSASEREAMIKEKEESIAKLEADFKAFVEGLNKQYQEESEKKDKATEAIKAGGLGLLKSVHSYMKKQEKSEL
mmetsp:Transcript_142164/g.442126  ORF Transcript_142164/g.442126 Transcript_142164/m.442126 type:complete len:169 (+) Transcript_142164:246-752(+)